MLPSSHLGEINSGIHMYQFTFSYTLLFSVVVVVLDSNKNFGGLTDLAEKKGTDRRICIPLFTPLLKKRIDQPCSYFTARTMPHHGDFASPLGFMYCASNLQIIY